MLYLETHCIKIFLQIRSPGSKLQQQQQQQQQQQPQQQQQKAKKVLLT